MYNYFDQTDFLKQELLIPFNEAMCYGDTSSDIFSQDFIHIRSRVHQVTTTQYAELTMKPLKPLFERRFSRITLWFDMDMFCQINLLTLLAWLDSVHYQGEVILHLVDEQYEIINSYHLNVEGYETIYNQVLTNKVNPGYVEPAPLNKGVERYLSYQEQDSDLMLYIQQHQDVPEKELIALLIKEFKNYGLGDTQYAELINAAKAYE